MTLLAPAQMSSVWRLNRNLINAIIFHHTVFWYEISEIQNELQSPWLAVSKT